MDTQAITVPPLRHLTVSPVPAWRLRATFAGKLPPCFYITPDVRFSNPGWDSEQFNRQIEQLEFFLPTGHKIIMCGMEAYNLFIECSQSFSRASWNGARIEALWLCGKLPHLSDAPEVEMWRIGQGKVIRQRKAWGQEWGGGPTRGWKFGVTGKPSSVLVQI